MGEPKTDLTNQVIGKLTVLGYEGKGKWACKCSCGNPKIKYIDTGKLKNRLVTSCGCDKDHSTKFKDLTGQTFGDWTVIKYMGSQKWLCQCSCASKTLREVDGRTLRNGLSTGCGHTRKELEYDLTGQTFGNWKVLRYAGNQEYLCECQCENKTQKVINGRTLRRGQSRSCGCQKTQLFQQTMLDRYNDISSRKIDSPREEWQIQATQNRETMINVINTFNHKPTINELANRIGITEAPTLVYIHSFGLEYLVDISPNKSSGELELINFLKTIIKPDLIETNTTRYLNGKELDIAIPSRKIAIEFNGTYWHSSIKKNYKYHQDKTIDCAKVGLRLIHIYEYEWSNSKQRIKIKDYLRDILTDTHKIYARNLELKYIGSYETEQFLNINHLQGYTHADINLAAYYNNELIGLMTFSIPRFQNNYDYEIIRFCWKSGYKVIGGAEKLFKRFISDYKPNSIVTYSEADKFLGSVYTRIGFIREKELTKPSYVWVSNHNKNVLTRYQTMKRDLVAKGLGNPEQTEDEIMTSLGYFKVYNCGNHKFTWKSNNNS